MDTAQAVLSSPAHSKKLHPRSLMLPGVVRCSAVQYTRKRSNPDCYAATERSDRVAAGRRRRRLIADCLKATGTNLSSKLYSTQLSPATGKFRPTTSFSSISESPKLRRLKARRHNNCLVASDTFTGFRKTMTSSSKKTTTVTTV